MTEHYEELESGCFAYGKMAGHSPWPCVIYNDMEEVPPEMRNPKAIKLKPGKDQVIAYFLNDWTFSIIHKKHIKTVNDIDEEEVMKACKKNHRSKLKEAIEMLKGMNEAKVKGEEAAVISAKPSAAVKDEEPASAPAASSAEKTKGGGKKKKGPATAAPTTTATVLPTAATPTTAAALLPIVTTSPTTAASEGESSKGKRPSKSLEEGATDSKPPQAKKAKKGKGGGRAAKGASAGAANDVDGVKEEGQMIVEKEEMPTKQSKDDVIVAPPPRQLAASSTTAAPDAKKKGGRKGTTGGGARAKPATATAGVLPAPAPAPLKKRYRSTTPRSKPPANKSAAATAPVPPPPPPAIVTRPNLPPTLPPHPSSPAAILAARAAAAVASPPPPPSHPSIAPPPVPNAPRLPPAPVLPPPPPPAPAPSFVPVCTGHKAAGHPQNQHQQHRHQVAGHPQTQHRHQQQHHYHDQVPGHPQHQHHHPQHHNHPPPPHQQQHPHHHHQPQPHHHPQHHHHHAAGGGGGGAAKRKRSIHKGHHMDDEEEQEDYKKEDEMNMKVHEILAGQDPYKMQKALIGLSNLFSQRISYDEALNSHVKAVQEASKEGGTYGYQHRRAPLRDVSLEGLIKEGVLKAESRLYLPDRRSPLPAHADGGNAIPAQYAVLDDQGLILFGTKIYQSVEDLLEEQRGMKLSKREKNGWAHVYYVENDRQGGGGDPASNSSFSSLAECVQQKMNERKEEAARKQLGVAVAFQRWARKDLIEPPAERKAVFAQVPSQQQYHHLHMMAGAAAAMAQPQLILPPPPPPLPPHVLQPINALSMIKQPFVGKEHKQGGKVIGGAAGGGGGGGVKPPPAEDDMMDDTVPAKPQLLAKKPPAKKPRKSTPPRTPMVEEEYKENPFLSFWKTVDPKAFEGAMEGYAIWSPGTFHVFEKDDTSPTPEDEGWTNTNETTGRLRKTSSRKSMRVSDRLHEIQGRKLPPHTLLICEEYGTSASTHHANATQPYKVKVHPDVPFLCDLHAHLADSEIIGFLAGRFDQEEKCLYIQAPFPCRATARNDDGSTDVEMDPGSEIEIRDVIDKNKMKVMGWYHSHPTFQPEPSLIDIENQYNYQTLLKDEHTSLEPFMGLIVGTYDDSMRQPVSIFRYFHVRALKVTSRGDNCVNFPMALDVLLAKDNPEKIKEEEDEDEEGRAEEKLASLKGGMDGRSTKAPHSQQEQQHQQQRAYGAARSVVSKPGPHHAPGLPPSSAEGPAGGEGSYPHHHHPNGKEGGIVSGAAAHPPPLAEDLGLLSMAASALPSLPVLTTGPPPPPLSPAKQVPPKQPHHHQQQLPHQQSSLPQPVPSAMTRAHSLSPPPPAQPVPVHAITVSNDHPPAVQSSSQAIGSTGGIPSSAAAAAAAAAANLPHPPTTVVPTNNTFHSQPVQPPQVHPNGPLSLVRPTVATSLVVNLPPPSSSAMSVFPPHHQAQPPSQSSAAALPVVHHNNSLQQQVDSQKPSFPPQQEQQQQTAHHHPIEAPPQPTTTTPMVVQQSPPPPPPASSAASQGGGGGGGEGGETLLTSPVVPAVVKQSKTPSNKSPAAPSPGTIRRNSVYAALKEKHQVQPFTPSDVLWSKLEGKVLGPETQAAAASKGVSLLGLRCTLETVRLLVRYYSRCQTRVNFDEEWRGGICKGEKFEMSLRKRVWAMPLGSKARRVEFLHYVMEYIMCCWEEGAPKKMSPVPDDPNAGSSGGTRRERRQAAAAAVAAVALPEAEDADDGVSL